MILEPNHIKASTLAVLIDGVRPFCVFIHTESHNEGSVVCSRGYQRSWSWTPGELSEWSATPVPTVIMGLSLFPKGTFHYYQMIPYLLCTCSPQKYQIIMGPFLRILVTLYVYLYKMEWFKPGDNTVTVLKIWLVILITPIIMEDKLSYTVERDRT